mmetsp:Transcript_13562/g.14979  ORF Transcript_13562/g.14979 Transcript_13562/m.14979 type:complete len:134 (+) Transcript_13562:139-540(+)
MKKQKKTSESLQIKMGKRAERLVEENSVLRQHNERLSQDVLNLQIENSMFVGVISKQKIALNEQEEVIKTLKKRERDLAYANATSLEGENIHGSEEKNKQRHEKKKCDTKSYRKKSLRKQKSKPLLKRITHTS